MTSRLPLVGWLAAVLAALSLTLATPAGAHSSQIGSTPEAGAVLEVPPRDVVVEFDTPLLDIGAAMVVRTSDGVLVSTGAPRIERRTIAVSLEPDAPDGTYTVAYRVVSQDGHTVESTFDFHVGPVVGQSAKPTAGPSSPASRSPASSVASAVASVDDNDGESRGSTTLVWIVAGVLLLVVIGVGTVLLRR